LVQTLHVARPRGGNRGRDGEGDPAARTGFDRSAHGFLGFLEGRQGRCRIAGEADARAVDAIEQVEPDIGLTGDGERLVEERVPLLVMAAMECDLGSPLERERLTGRGRDLAVQLDTRGEVRVRLV
jgi:hypothetical protein